MLYRIGVISNPFARLVRKNPSANNELQSLLSNRGLFRVTQTTAQLAEALRDFREQGVTCLGIVGGDGSINLVLAELLKLHCPRSLPSILVLGGGTANVLALNLGLNSNPIKVMSDFLNVNATCPNNFRHVTIPSLNINGHTGFLFANGIASRFLELFYRNKGNAADAALLLARAALHSAVPKSPLIHDAQKFNALGVATPMTISASERVNTWANSHPNVTTVFVSSLKYMGFGIPLFHNLNGINAELFATSLEKRALAWQLARMFFHRPIVHTHSVNDLVSEVKVVTSSHEPYTIDGELFDAPKEGVIIKIGQPFNFVTPYEENNGAQTALHHRRHWLKRFDARPLRRRKHSLP
jgi:hypothetical protein